MVKFSYIIQVMCQLLHTRSYKEYIGDSSALVGGAGAGGRSTAAPLRVADAVEHALGLMAKQKRNSLGRKVRNK